MYSAEFPTRRTLDVSRWSKIHLAGLLSICSGQPIPRVEYTDDELKCWGIVYRSLVSLFPTHACDIHVKNFRMLERECGYSDKRVPQLDDVSNYLRSKYIRVAQITPTSCDKAGHLPN